MRRIFAATSIESALRSKVQGFAFGTNRWVFVSMLASAFLFAVTDILSLKVVFGMLLKSSQGPVSLRQCLLPGSLPPEIHRLQGASRRSLAISGGGHGPDDPSFFSSCRLQVSGEVDDFGLLLSSGASTSDSPRQHPRRRSCAVTRPGACGGRWRDRSGPRVLATGKEQAARLSPGWHSFPAICMRNSAHEPRSLPWV